jgi:type II secretory pathway pseudopilin PulG
MISIRNIAIAAVVAVVAFTSFTGSSDAVASAKATSTKIQSRTAAIDAAIDAAQ